MLPVKLPLMRGSIVEILASRDRLDYIVTNPRVSHQVLPLASLGYCSGHFGSASATGECQGTL